jgi:hypothetical protein
MATGGEASCVVEARLWLNRAESMSGAPAIKAIRLIMRMVFQEKGAAGCPLGETKG